MDTVKRKPGRPRNDAAAGDAPVVAFVVAKLAMPEVAHVLYRVALPEHLADAAVNLDTDRTMDSDLRSAIEAELGCNFRMADAKLACARGIYMLHVVGDVVELRQ